MIRPAAILIGFPLVLLAGKAANIVADAGPKPRAASVSVLQLLPPRATTRDGGFSSTPPPARAGAGDSVGTHLQECPNGRFGKCSGLPHEISVQPRRTNLLGASRREDEARTGGDGERRERSIQSCDDSAGVHGQDIPLVQSRGRTSLPYASIRLIDAIRSTESGGSDVSRPNRKGALGPYQFLRATWNDHASGVPWSQAVDEPTARVVAVRYLAWLDRTISKWQGKPASLEQVLASWNGGVGRLRERGFAIENMPAESREFVVRVKKAMEEQR